MERLTASHRRKLPGPAVFGILAGSFASLAAIAVAVLVLLRTASRPEPGRPLAVRLDSGASFVLLATPAAQSEYADALSLAGDLHPGAGIVTFHTDGLDTLLERLKTAPPAYAMVFILPAELDVNFAWRWLHMAAALDQDPFVDMRTGFITAATPDDASAFVRRVADACAGRLELPGMLVDNLGPNPQGAPGSFHAAAGSFFLPVLEQRLGMLSISHGVEGFADNRLASMRGAGIVHLGGHGFPDRVVDGLTASQAARLDLSPCVVFSGACYTGVTGRWFETVHGQNRIAARLAAADESLALALISNNAVGCLAAMHPDHGIPVYQEIEFLAETGCSLGDALKHTHDGVILAAGGSLPQLELSDGQPPPRWTPSQVMLYGTASRVLFGDPAMRLMEPLPLPPLDVAAETSPGAITLTVRVRNPLFRSAFTDTYHDDLAWRGNMFNDRLLLRYELPPGWDVPSDVRVLGAGNAETSIRHRLVAWAIERDGGANILHVLADLASTGYMQSEWRKPGACMGLEIRR
ncbi:MAG: hypothetical protein JW909_02690 [Planctomycetes bacterium]|nr:hypothetical protein [Planctomycetota bacterium]